MAFKTSTVGGLTFYTLANDRVVGKCIELYGEWTLGEVELLARLLPKEANVVELGSNIGAHTVFLARFVTPAGAVYAFEPRRLYFQLLCANLTANGVTNVHAHRLAAAESRDVIVEGPVPLATPINAGGLSLGSLQGTGERIEVTALDDMLGQFAPVALIKADVEGYELSALRGTRSLIARDRPILYLEADPGPRSAALESHVRGLGYRSWRHAVPYFRPNNRGGTIFNVFPNGVARNLLAIPSERTELIARVDAIEVDGLVRDE